MTRPDDAAAFERTNPGQLDHQRRLGEAESKLALVAGLERKLEQYRVRIAELEATLRAAHASIDEAHERSQSLERGLEVVHGSRSWRMTAPVRAAMGMLRRVASGAPQPRSRELDSAERLWVADPTDNFSYNRALWDSYAEAWNDPEFRRQSMDDMGVERDVAELRVLGDEWGTPAEVDQIVQEWIRPFLGAETVVGEIGSGGGRIASRIVDEVGELYCFDVSERMLERLGRLIGQRANVYKVLLAEPGLPVQLAGRFDFLYAFDVFVHLDLHMLWRYLQDVELLLRPDGRAFLHTANLAAPAGWERFAAQERDSVEGHLFVTPDVVRTLLSHTSLRIVRESSDDSTNFYLRRDFLCLVEKSA